VPTPTYGHFAGGYYRCPSAAALATEDGWWKGGGRGLAGRLREPGKGNPGEFTNAT